MMKKLFSLILALALSLACVSALAEGAFPVEIQHAYGTTVIEAEPERVATLFDSNPDPVLALGVPTVTEASTLARDLTGSDAALPKGSFLVSPGEIDLLVQRSAAVLAEVLDRALLA